MCKARGCIGKLFAQEESGRGFEIIARGSCRLVQVQFYYADTNESWTGGRTGGWADGWLQVLNIFPVEQRNKASSLTCTNVHYRLFRQQRYTWYVAKMETTMVDASCGWRRRGNKHS